MTHLCDFCGTETAEYCDSCGNYLCNACARNTSDGMLCPRCFKKFVDKPIPSDATKMKFKKGLYLYFDTLCTIALVFLILAEIFVIGMVFASIYGYI